MKSRLSLACAIAIAIALLAGCAGDSPGPVGRAATSEAPPTAAPSVQAYKVALANHIAATNGNRMYAGRPQALLRSVVVVKYAVDGEGKLLRSEIMRSNRDRTAEATALSTLRNSAPFPRPASHLLQRGRLELAETWLFNNDGRFQLRSTAHQQMNE